MRAYLDWMKRSGLMGAFLKHRAWAWRAALALPVLSTLPVGFCLGVWFVLVPGLILLPITIVLSIAGLDPDYAVILPAIVIVTALLPITVVVLLDLIPAILACVGLMFGRAKPAEAMLAQTTMESNEWKTLRD